MTKQITKAEELAKFQREISVSEFFTKNRHLLGFDNPHKALLTTVKEAVDNSLDATQEMQVLPEILVEIHKATDDRFRIVVEDNGPGIVKEQIPRIFAKLLYGSKFHAMKQSRGQQGIGISASVMYAQLTTGKPTKITSKISPKRPAHYYELHIDTKRNEPEIITDREVPWQKDHGTRIELELEGTYQRGRQGVDEYLKQTAIVNPHLHLVYLAPDGQRLEFPRATKEIPIEPKEIKPHPYGVELGALMNMLKDTKQRTLKSFLTNDFSRVSDKTANEVCLKAQLKGTEKPSGVDRVSIERVFRAIQQIKIMAPPTNCLSPIGEELMLKGLQKEINAEFFTSVTRPPSVYRGMPFQIEAGMAYGGDLSSDDLARILRFANRVPLLYQQGACASSRAIVQTAWRNYGISQSKGALPSGPIMIVIHVASVWVPFTSESKEAIAHYPEIIKEMKLALQEVGRKVASYIRKTVKAKEHREKANLFEKYIPELAHSLSDISGEKKDTIEQGLMRLLRKLLPVLINHENSKEIQTKS